MDPFSEAEEAFFRTGELMSRPPADTRRSWFQRLLRRPQPTPQPHPAPAQVDGYYASYELLGTAEYALMAA